jgi:hypothetical protein
MIRPTEKPVVKILGMDGNAFAIIGRVQKALKEAGADEEYVTQYQQEAMSGDYSNLLMVTMDYVNVN